MHFKDDVACKSGRPVDQKTLMKKKDRRKLRHESWLKSKGSGVYVEMWFVINHLFILNPGYIVQGIKLIAAYHATIVKVLNAVVVQLILIYALEFNNKE